jgi:hypothetical protein
VDPEDQPSLDIEDAADAFLKAMSDETDDPPEDLEDDGQDPDGPEEGPEDDDPEVDVDSDPAEDSDPDPVAEPDDDAEVSFKVGDETKRLKVSELKALGQREAAINGRNESVVRQSREIEAQARYLASVLDVRYKQAEAEVQKYANVDLFKASRDLEAEDFDALQASMKAAQSNFQAIDQEAKTFLQNANNTRTSIIKARAGEALKVITEQIPEWSEDMYGSIRTYAVSQGMDRETVNETVDPSVIIMMNKAMKYDAMKAATKAVAKKVAKAPTTSLRKADTPSDASASRLNAAKRAASQSGSVDDVADLFFKASKE